MFAAWLEKIIGKDDLESVAEKGNPGKLFALLGHRKVLVARKPRRYIDPAELTKENLLAMIDLDAQELAKEPFQPWVLTSNEKKRLPIFSNAAKLENFAKRIAAEMKMVMAVGSAECLIHEIVRREKIDFIDLNLFSEKSREIETNTLQR